MSVKARAAADPVIAAAVREEEQALSRWHQSLFVKRQRPAVRRRLEAEYVEAYRQTNKLLKLRPRRGGPA